MAKEDTTGTGQVSEGSRNLNAQKQKSTTPLVNGTAAAPSSVLPQKGHQHRGSGKGARRDMGGTALPGARSTQPRAISEASNAQQQQYDSYNRDMRRRMDRMGYDDDQSRTQSSQNKRKKRMDRLKERRQQQLSQIKKSLPGGKVDTSTRRVYYMIAAVAVLVILVIAIFAILRWKGILH
jgi:hypothetical protein